MQYLTSPEQLFPNDATEDVAAFGALAALWWFFGSPRSRAGWGAQGSERNFCSRGIDSPRWLARSSTRGTGGVRGEQAKHPRGRYVLVKLEPMTGIEPAYSAWEADVLPLNYIGADA